MHDIIYKTTLSRAIEQARIFFKDYNFEELPRKQFPKNNLTAAWRGSIKCAGADIYIIIGIPHLFPDELPKIFLTEDFKYFPIPHVDNKLFVCTYDSNRITFYPEEVNKILEETVEKAREIISKGIVGTNENDFSNEFLAYWNGEFTNYSIIEPIDGVLEIYVAQINSNIKGFKEVIGNDTKQIEQYVTNINQHSEVIRYQPCIYLPFKSPPIPPIPENCKEIIQLIERNNPEYKDILLKYLNHNNFTGTVLFSVKFNELYSLAGWKHRVADKNAIVKGFRLGKLPLSVLEERLSSQRITRFNIERLDTSRLQKRVGNYNNILENKKVIIVGCGSIGSHIGFSIACSGIGELILTDDDILVPENITRHVCGMGQINQAKVDSLSQKLRNHFPNLKVQVIKEKIQKVILDNNETLINSDLIICATGNTVSERRLNKYQMYTPNCPPILYVWLEPWGIASQALLIQKGVEESCLECCLTPKLDYIYSVVQLNNKEFIMQEAGCQTSYTPFSAVDAEQASSFAARLAISFLNGDIVKSTRYTWLGDLDLIKKLECEINPIFEGKPSFCLQIDYPKKKGNCPYCNASAE